MNLKDALSDRPTDRPFFLFVHIWDVHCQNLGVAGKTVYDPPEGFDDLFVPDARERLEGIIASDMWHGRRKSTPEEIEAVVALYDGSIRYADSMIEGWVEGWRSEGLLDDTLVIVTSDHGEGLAQRKRRLLGHGEMYEEGLAVPLIVRPPGAAPQAAPTGVRRDVLTSLADIVPYGAGVGRSTQGTLVAGLLAVRRDSRGPHALGRAAAGHCVVSLALQDRHVAEHATSSAARLRSRAGSGEETPVLERADPELFAEFRATLKAELEAHEARWGPMPGDVIPGQESTPAEVEALRGVGYFGEEEDEE